MKNYGLLTLLLLLLTLPLGKTSEAKLLIIPPQEMINQSSLIVIGTVTKREYSEETRQVVISIDRVVKGTIQQKEIVFKRNKPNMYGWLGFDFPEKGTTIMVLLQQNNELTLTGDTNAVAVLDQHQVKLHNGFTMGQYTPEKYEDAYNSYLAANGGTELPAVEANNKQQFPTFIIISFIIGCLAAAIFLMVRTLKRKRLN